MRNDWRRDKRAVEREGMQLAWAAVWQLELIGWLRLQAQAMEGQTRGS